MLTRPVNDWTMKLIDFHRQSLAWTATRIAAARGHEDARVPGTDWTAADLAGHLVAVNVMCSSSAAGIGPEAMPDPAGFIDTDPIGAVASTSARFSAAFADPAIYATIVPTPVGPHPASVVLTQGTLEHLIHGYDLARALGANATIPHELVVEALARIVEQPALYNQFREMGMYAAPLPAAPDASAQDRLLGALGRPPT
jgi:uncharacterized protein (TIGR03086 family)